MIRAEKLVKRYGELSAVDGVSFEVGKGEVYGLLGPNGAGKTTTLSMIAGLLRPDQGRILLDGTDMAVHPMAVKAQLGVVPQETAIYEELTARENLRFWGGLYGLSGRDLGRAVEQALEQVELTGRADERVKHFSGGMKRRLNLSVGLVHRPRAVLLDEPTVGIDPQARLNILEVVRSIAAAGTAVLYTTHYLEEAESLCDRIGIMDHGRVLVEGTLEELKRMVGEEEVVTIRGRFEVEEARKSLAGIPGVRAIKEQPGELVLSVPGTGEGAAALLSAVFGGSLEVERISIQSPSLNGLFLKMTGRELRD